MLTDYLDILKPGHCVCCKSHTLTYTDCEGEQLCLLCLEACLEELRELPADPALMDMTREIIAELRTNKGETNHARN